MKRFAIVAAVLIVAFGCRTTPPQPSRPAATQAVAPVTDDDGVRHPAGIAARRIVSLAPQLTETLFALGAGRKVVGTMPGETHPPEATTLPFVNRPDSPEPDVGKIRELRPDLVLATGRRDAAWKQQLSEAQIAVATFNATGIKDAIADMASVARLIAVSAAGLGELTAEIAAVIKSVEGRKPVKVFVEAIYPPLMGVGGGGFVEDMVETAGGVMVAASTPAETFEWSPSDVLQAGTQVYVAPLSSAGDEREVVSRPGFAAMKSLRVTVLSDDLLFRPGPRLGDGLSRIADALYPDRRPG